MTLFSVGIIIVFGAILASFLIGLSEEEWSPFRTIFFLGILISIPLFYFSIKGVHKLVNQGEHTGYITAVEKGGLIWKTGTAYVKTDTQSSQEDAYCVMDDSVFQRLEEAQRTKEKITVYFKAYFEAGLENCAGESDFIYDLKQD